MKGPKTNVATESQPVKIATPAMPAQAAPAATQSLPHAGMGHPSALPNLRVARYEDYPHIQRLESSHGLLTLSEQDWRSIWQDHPLCARLKSDWPIGWVLEDVSGSIVGAMANIPSRYALGGEELLAATGRGWVVAEQFRGYALWIMDEYFNQEGVDLFINTTVNSMAVDPFTAFGSQRVPLGDWNHAAYWITHHSGFARAALTIKHVPAPGLLGAPIGVALRMKDAFTAKYPDPSSPALAIEYADRFDNRFDNFWEELKGQKPDTLLNVRDRSTLSWHFAGPMRSKQLWILTATRGGLLRAYAIFKRQDHPPSGLVRTRLVDYQCLDNEDALPAFVNAALRRCSAEKIHTLEHVGCALPKMRAFDQLAPYRRELPAWPYYWKAASTTIHQHLLDQNRWDPSSFDGDASL
jgi:hypothetical protein